MMDTVEPCRRLASEKLTERGWRGSKTTNWRNSPSPPPIIRTVQYQETGSVWTGGRLDHFISVERVAGPCHVMSNILPRSWAQDARPGEPHEIYEPRAGHGPSTFSPLLLGIGFWDLPSNDAHDILAHYVGLIDYDRAATTRCRLRRRWGKDSRTSGRQPWDRSHNRAISSRLERL